jgi:uncharacterized protein YdhG (YjbR/CyaY superfamily)
MRNFADASPGDRAAYSESPNPDFGWRRRGEFSSHCCRQRDASFGCRNFSTEPHRLRRRVSILIAVPSSPWPRHLYRLGDLEAACLAAIAEMSGSDRDLAEVLHELVKTHTALGAKTWYGMPAYTNADGKVVVFFQSAAKFKVRYATIGFQEAANLDEGNFWPNAYAVTSMTAADKKQLAALLEKAVR